MNERYLTREQLADLWQVHPRTLLRWAQEDPPLPTQRVGRLLRYNLPACDAWQRERTARQHYLVALSAGLHPASPAVY